MAKRSLSGSMVYFVVTLLLAWTTPYYAEHAAMLAVASALTLFLGMTRTVSAFRLLKQPATDRRVAKRLFVASLNLLFLVWGAFSGLTVKLYADQWTAMYVLLATASLAAGASSSLAPDRKQAYVGLVLLIVPNTAAAISQADRQGFAIAAGTLLYLGFLLAQAREHSEAFWNASIAAERERIRGSAQRRRAEEERASLAAAVEQSAEQILVTKADGTIQYCNPAFERVTGYGRNEVVGRNPRFLKSGKQDEAYYREMWATISAGGVWAGRFTNRKKDGSIYEAEGTISPICDASGKTTGYVAAMHDVTERLRMEADLQQAQKMEGIGRLAGGVAHDFNNLLTVISGYGGLLESRLPEQDTTRLYVAEIKKAADRASALTRQLLTFSRKQLIRPKPIDLNVLVGDMHRILQRLLGEDIEVAITAAPSLGLVKADPDQISQILLNLTANARDAMPEGGKLIITTSNVEPDGSPLGGPAVLLAVSDSGIGINSEALDHIFEPFFTTKEKGRGTGLGLATVYGIVQQSSGIIEVSSEVGRGTTFQIYLPRIDAGLVAAQTDAPAPAAVRGSETILVVEDHDDVRQMIIASLESCGFQVLQAANGRAGFAVSAQFEGTIDLLLTDVIMPGITGKALADQLKLTRPGIKVLYISGYSGEVIAHRGVLDADVAYLPKPFTPTALAAKVREVLG
ncbi:MAG TPA: PAS domain S-box protein [Candidatus Acidoferrales bacterium]|nr:PAS domain S-box protein [Candidatus Acidoferrales bacterium]